MRKTRLRSRPKPPVVFRCSECSKPVKRAKTGAGLCRECSQRQNARRRDFTRSGKSRNCERCGEAFYATPHELARNRRFCSRRCSNLARRRAKTCPICGAEFRRDTKTCSRECANEARRRSKSGERNPNFKGAGNRRSPRWRSQAERECRNCGSRSRLHLHHVVYEQHVRARGGDLADPRNSLTLCLTCHFRHHHSLDARIPTSKFRAVNFEFARELLGPGVRDYLVRYYDLDIELAA